MYKIISLILFTTFCIASVASKELDPTKPFTQLVMNKTNIQEHFVLYSIINSGNDKIAVINNQNVVVGDSIGEYTIEAIEQNAVTLSNSKENIELSLFADDLIK